MDSDDVYKRNHPIAYKLIVTLGLIAFIGPLVILGLVFMLNDPGKTNTSFALLGAFGAMIIGIGLFNFVAILMKQYLGHLLSILCFLIGGLMVFVCLRFLY